MEEAIRDQENMEFGLYCRSIFGLNIFSANDVDVDVSGDPRFVFLRSVCERTPSSAHIGSLYDMADSPEEIFGSPDTGAYYMRESIGVYGGMFYDTNTWPTFPGCFFPIVNSNFWNIGLNISRSIMDILELDAVAFYVNYRDEINSKIRSLFSEKFISHERWLVDVAGIYDLVIVSRADGGYFTAYSASNANFELLSPAISSAIKVIENNAWYKQNSLYMKWDEEYEMCLVRN